MTAQILCFWRDLRLDDNPALVAAAAQGPVLPVFIIDQLQDLGSAQYWWLAHSLSALRQDLRLLGSELLLLSWAELQALLAQGLPLHLNSPLDRVGQGLVTELQTQFGEQCLQLYAGNTLLAQPLFNQQGKAYQVFTPFWKRCLQVLQPEAPLDMPSQLPMAQSLASQFNKRDFEAHIQALLPKIPWHQEFSHYFNPGERGAQQQLSQFLEQGVERYPDSRNLPAQIGTARISPHLRFGELSIRRIVQRLLALGYGWDFELVWLRELGWREFAYHCYRLFPEVSEQPLQSKFAHFPWQQQPDWLKAWQQGQTGVPIVDAGMRELWRFGWMHNRVRMVVGSYLVKNLRLPWQQGRAWFDDCLLDADPAVNALSWQWVAGCGADAAPYFRIFNPVSQAEKFDPDGQYIGQMVPELHGLPSKWQRQPWLLPSLSAQQLNFRLGKQYPMPLVDLKESREQALAAFKTLTGQG